MLKKFYTLIVLSFLLLPGLTSADQWTFRIAPYIWGINMQGRVQTGPIKVHVDENFDDILRHLNFAGMVWFDATNGRYGLYANLLYSVLKNNVSDGPASLSATNKFGIFSAGASYQIYRYNFANVPGRPDSVTFEPYIGLRYTLNNVATHLSLGPFSLSGTNNQHWTDPLIGMRARFELNKAWSFILAGDIGGTNAASHYSYDINGLFGYQPQTHFTNTTIYFGYRLLDQHYVTGNGINYFNWNMKIFGPLLGIAIKL